MDGLRDLVWAEQAFEDTYSSFEPSKLISVQQLDQEQPTGDLFISDMALFLQQPQQLSHLSSSCSEDDLAQAADVVTADLNAALMQAHQCSTPPPAMHPGAHMPAQQQMQSMHFKQETSGAAGSSCGGCWSPQASCDTAAALLSSAAAAAAKAHQFWSTQQYDAAYNLMLAHSPVNQYPAVPMHGPYGSSAGMGMPGAPCAGPCCVPGGLMPQGSGSLGSLGAGSVTCMAPAHMDYSYGAQGSMQGYAARYPNPAGAFGNAGPPAAAGMVPHAAFGSNLMARQHSAPPAGLPLAPQHSTLQPTMPRAYSAYPRVQGGVQKKSSAAALGSKPSAAEGRAARKSADGSCSSKDGSPAPLPKARRMSKGASSAAAAGTAATGSGGSAGRSRGSGCVGAPAAAAAVAASGPAATLIKELQQEVETLATAKAQLKTQVRNLLTFQTDLLSRVATVTTKWQQAVAENAALHRQNLQLAASQGM